MIAIFCHIFVILIDRYLYLGITSTAVQRANEPMQREEDVSWLDWLIIMIPFLVKLLMHITLTIFIHILVFFLYPLTGNLKVGGDIVCREPKSTLYTAISTCNDFEINFALRWFYILYVCYLVISALQLKLGVPSYRKGSFPLTQYYNLPSKWAFQVYLQLPFLFELRTLTDWAFTKTALDFWQWLKFEDLYARLYVTKVNQSYYIDRVIGEPIDKCYKFWIGICGTLGTILIIMAPLLIFSSLNFIVEANPVRTMSAEFGILVQANYFRMFSVSRIQDMHELTEMEWKRVGFSGENGRFGAFWGIFGVILFIFCIFMSVFLLFWRFSRPFSLFFPLFSRAKAKTSVCSATSNPPSAKTSKS